MNSNVKKNVMFSNPTDSAGIVPFPLGRKDGGYVAYKLLLCLTSVLHCSIYSVRRYEVYRNSAPIRPHTPLPVRYVPTKMGIDTLPTLRRDR